MVCLLLSDPFPGPQHHQNSVFFVCLGFFWVFFGFLWGFFWGGGLRYRIRLNASMDFAINFDYFQIYFQVTKIVIVEKNHAKNRRKQSQLLKLVNLKFQNFRSGVRDLLIYFQVDNPERKIIGSILMHYQSFFSI